MNQDILEVLQKIDEDNQDRNAYSSINGYFYQFELTLLHLLEDGEEQDSFGETTGDRPSEFRVELVEDYVKYYEKDGKQHIRAAQIKHHTTYAGQSKYIEAVLWLYCGFLKYYQLERDDLTYKAVLYHFDRSPDDKDMLKALTKGLDENKDKDKDKQDEAYRQIVEIEKKYRDVELRAEFSKISEFKKVTYSLQEIREKLKGKLRLRYSSVRGEYNEAYLYAAAVSKLINDGRDKNTLSLELLDHYFKNEHPQVNSDFYTRKIIDQVICLIAEHVEDVEYPQTISSFLGESEVPSVDEELVNKYIKIARKLKDFMMGKLQIPEYRKSFLNTVVAGKVSSYEINALSEYERFLDYSDSIKAFIAKLAKIVFYHQSLPDETVDLNHWFEIGSSVWLFKYPYEARRDGVILGDVRQSDYAPRVMGELLERLSENKIKPNVWYLGLVGDIRSHHKQKYKPTQTKIDDEDSPCKPGDDSFYIQCLNCLGVTQYDRIDTVSNIFMEKCKEEV
jgi:hypothetical protein